MLLFLERASAKPAVGAPMLLFWLVIGLVAAFLIISNRKKKTLKSQREHDAKGSVADRLEALSVLLEKGIISQEEFDAKKKELLGLK